MSERKVIKEAFDSISDDSLIFINKLNRITSRILQILEEKGWSKQRLAREMDKEPSELSKWLNTPHNLTLKSISKIEAALNETIINVPSTYEFKYASDDEREVKSIKTVVPAQKEEMDDSNYTQPKESTGKQLQEYIASHG